MIVHSSDMQYYDLARYVTDAVSSSTGLIAQKVKPDVYYYEFPFGFLGSVIDYNNIVFH